MKAKIFCDKCKYKDDCIIRVNVEKCDIDSLAQLNCFIWSRSTKTRTISAKCKNCGYSIISNDNEKHWGHGIIGEDGQALITPINHSCQKAEPEKKSFNSNARITGIIVHVVRDDGSILIDTIDPEQEFVADLYQHIRYTQRLQGVVGAMIYLLNLGSKAITGINPKDYENVTKTHFGQSRNINSMHNTNIIQTKIQKRKEDYQRLLRTAMDLGDKRSSRDYEMKIYVLEWVQSLFNKQD